MDQYTSRLEKMINDPSDYGKLYQSVRYLIKDISKEHRKYAKTQYKYSSKFFNDGETHFLDVLAGWERFHNNNSGLRSSKKLDSKIKPAAKFLKFTRKEDRRVEETTKEELKSDSEGAFWIGCLRENNLVLRNEYVAETKTNFIFNPNLYSKYEIVYMVLKGTHIYIYATVTGTFRVKFCSII